MEDSDTTAIAVSTGRIIEASSVRQDDTKSCRISTIGDSLCRGAWRFCAARRNKRADRARQSDRRSEYLARSPGFDALDMTAKSIQYRASLGSSQTVINFVEGE